MKASVRTLSLTLVGLALCVVVAWLVPHTHDWGWHQLGISGMDYKPTAHVITRWQAGELEYVLTISAGDDIRYHLKAAGVACVDKNSINLFDRTFGKATRTRGEKWNTYTYQGRAQLGILKRLRLHKCHAGWQEGWM